MATEKIQAQAPALALRGNGRDDERERAKKQAAMERWRHRPPRVRTSPPRWFG